MTAGARTGHNSRMNRQERRTLRSPMVATAAADATADRLAVTPEFTDAMSNGLKAVLPGALTAVMQSPEFSHRLRTRVRESCDDIVTEILAESEIDLDQRVRAIVSAEWDGMVARAAHEILETKLQDVRRRLLST